MQELKEEWLKTGWSEDTLAHPLIHTLGSSETEKSGLTWTADQVSLDIHVTIGWQFIYFKRPGGFRSLKTRSDTLGERIPIEMARMALMRSLEMSISLPRRRRLGFA